MKVRFRRYTFRGGAAGHGLQGLDSSVVELEVGKLRIFLERNLGLYGYPHTTSYGIRGWWER